MPKRSSRDVLWTTDAVLAALLAAGSTNTSLYLPNQSSPDNVLRMVQTAAQLAIEANSPAVTMDMVMRANDKLAAQDVKGEN